MFVRLHCALMRTVLFSHSRSWSRFHSAECTPSRHHARTGTDPEMARSRHVYCFKYRRLKHQTYYLESRPITQIYKYLNQ